MRRIGIGCLALLLAAPAAAAAQERDEADRDWRLVGFSHSRQVAHFIDAGSIVRDAGQVEFDVLTLYRQMQQTEWISEFDNELESYRADCSRGTYRPQAHYARVGRAPVPPSIIGVQERGPPPAGSSLEAGIRIACGHEQPSPDRVRDPWDIWEPAGR